MSVRTKRLKADYDQISTHFSSNSRIKILETTGSPPDKYQVEFLVSSLQKSAGQENPKIHNSFIAEISLTGSYPRMAPQCRMLTPVFHPNIAPHAICIGDHWAAGESLSVLIARIGEILSFQSYNVKSPLNGEAAKWVEKNIDKLPLDNFDFPALLDSGQVLGKNKDGSIRSSGICSNCNAKESIEDNITIHVCINDHTACQDCIIKCTKCDRLICLSCSLNKCNICNETSCHNCIFHCNNCDQNACKSHAARCNVCTEIRCHDCMIKCYLCKKATCLDHIEKKIVESKKIYSCHNCIQQSTNE